MRFLRFSDRDLNHSYTGPCHSSAAVFFKFYKTLKVHLDGRSQFASRGSGTAANRGYGLDCPPVNFPRGTGAFQSLRAGGRMPALARCCFCIAASLLVFTSPIRMPFYLHVTSHPLNHKKQSSLSIPYQLDRTTCFPFPLASPNGYPDAHLRAERNRTSAYIR